MTFKIKSLATFAIGAACGVGIELFFWNENPAFASGFTPVFGYAQGSVNFVPTTGFTTASHSSALLYGFLFDFKAFKALSVEFGTLYAPRGFVDTVTATSVSNELTLNTIQFPFLFKFYLVPSIALGVGGYFSHGMGSIQIGSSTITYKDAGLGADDYGALVSLGLQIAILPYVSLMGDFRYLYGLQNISQISSISTTLSDIQFLAGVRFGGK